jgi:hypothetical protein
MCSPTPWLASGPLPLRKGPPYSSFAKSQRHEIRPKAQIHYDLLLSSSPRDSRTDHGRSRCFTHLDCGPGAEGSGLEIFWRVATALFRIQRRSFRNRWNRKLEYEALDLQEGKRRSARRVSHQGKYEQNAKAVTRPCLLVLTGYSPSALVDLRGVGWGFALESAQGAILQADPTEVPQLDDARRDIGEDEMTVCHGCPLSVLLRCEFERRLDGPQSSVLLGDLPPPLDAVSETGNQNSPG